MAQHVGICGEKRKALIDDISLPAEEPYLAVPAETGVAAVLDEGRRFGVGCSHLLKLPQPDIAHAEKAGATGIAFTDHGLPHCGVIIGPVVPGRRAVEHVAVNVIGAEMLERACHGLRNLSGEAGRGIVWQPVILVRLIGEFCLQKKVRTGDKSTRDKQRPAPGLLRPRSSAAAGWPCRCRETPCGWQSR